ncbi:hypothetical protein AB0E59_20825 [Lentzea sp. NPDC034063]|uniref:hypothetical protein n=1 Tax=unclassified Lentzea TaxID=2643253 RepID=UPI0034035335
MRILTGPDVAAKHSSRPGRCEAWEGADLSWSSPRATCCPHDQPPASAELHEQ